MPQAIAARTSDVELHSVVNPAAAAVTIAIPAILAYNASPSATFLNQAAALIGWAVWLLLLSASLQGRTAAAWPRGPGELLAAMGVLAAAALSALPWTGLPASLAVSSFGLLIAAAVGIAVAAAVGRTPDATHLFHAVCVGLCLAGVTSALIAILQVFFPDLLGEPWIADTTPGRAIGNLRQPNHLSTLLLWSMIALTWLIEAGRVKRVVGAGLMLLMLFGVVLSASRTGMVGVLMLAAWGVVDKRLSPSTRRLLWALPVAYVVMWAGVTAWSNTRGETFVGEAQLHKRDISSSRFAIWKNTLSLIAAHPWLGVGFGEFNFAWSLTPFPDRPVAFFDHTHNLILQFAVELGLPLAALVLALFGRALWIAYVNARDASAEEAPMLRAGFMIVLVAVVHSQLEYPLWYSYFLLPFSFVFGLILARPGADAAPSPVTASGRRGSRSLAIAALVMLLGSVFSVLDYWRVVVIFQPPEHASPLAQRIAEGQRSVFFSHHADYAAATTAAHPSTQLPALNRAAHFLLDTRLMTAWAVALNEAGDVDRARHIAQRLREFRNPQSDEFFAPCKTPKPAGEPFPFQCEAPKRYYDYRDFR